MGRDVVGYATPHRHEGEWDNFQCKQLSARLSEKDAFVELGKIFMHAAAGDYSLPRSYTFVAPKGVVRNVQNFIAHPSRFRQAFLNTWDAIIAPELVENQIVPLTPEIRDAIERFAFEHIYWLDAVGLADDPYAKPRAGPLVWLRPRCCTARRHSGDTAGRGSTVHRATDRSLRRTPRYHLSRLRRPRWRIRLGGRICVTSAPGISKLLRSIATIVIPPRRTIW